MPPHPKKTPNKPQRYWVFSIFSVFQKGFTFSHWCIKGLFTLIDKELEFEARGSGNEGLLVSSRLLKQAVMEQSISFFPLKSVQAWSEAQLENMLKAAKQTRLQLKLSAKVQYNSCCPEFNSLCHAAGQTRERTYFLALNFGLFETNGWIPKLHACYSFCLVHLLLAGKMGVMTPVHLLWFMNCLVLQPWIFRISKCCTASIEWPGNKNQPAACQLSISSLKMGLGLENNCSAILQWAILAIK